MRKAKIFQGDEEYFYSKGKSNFMSRLTYAHISTANQKVCCCTHMVHRANFLSTGKLDLHNHFPTHKPSSCIKHFMENKL